MDFFQYVSEIKRQFNSGIAKEHAYRPAFSGLFNTTLIL